MHIEFSGWSYVFQELTVLEEELLNKPINFAGCQIDPAPFQLVERTSLYKVQTNLQGLDS